MMCKNHVTHFILNVVRRLGLPKSMMITMIKIKMIIKSLYIALYFISFYYKFTCSQLKKKKFNLKRLFHIRALHTGVLGYFDPMEHYHHVSFIFLRGIYLVHHFDWCLDIFPVDDYEDSGKIADGCSSMAFGYAWKSQYSVAF